MPLQGPRHLACRARAQQGLGAQQHLGPCGRRRAGHTAAFRDDAALQVRQRRGRVARSQLQLGTQQARLAQRGSIGTCARE